MFTQEVNMAQHMYLFFETSSFLILFPIDYFNFILQG